jgi:hypothetical protein
MSRDKGKVPKGHIRDFKGNVVKTGPGAYWNSSRFADAPGGIGQSKGTTRQAVTQAREEARVRRFADRGQSKGSTRQAVMQARGEARARKSSGTGGGDVQVSAYDRGGVSVSSYTRSRPGK